MNSLQTEGNFNIIQINNEVNRATRRCCSGVYIISFLNIRSWTEHSHSSATKLSMSMFSRNVLSDLVHTGDGTNHGFKYISENTADIFNRKKARGRVGGPSKNAFPKMHLLERQGEPLLFGIFNIIISDTFPENFIEIPQVIQKIRRFSSSILTIFIFFSDFLTFPCCKETDNVSI